MPFNGSGTFVALAPPNFPAVPGTVILASQFNNNLNDIFTTGLTNCITRDGQSPPTNNLPMAGFKFTNIGAGVADTDSAQLGQMLAVRGQVGAVDWNTRITNGIFEATAAALTGPASNFPPTTLLGELIVIAQGALIDQIYKTSVFTHTRQKLAGTWSNWTNMPSQYNYFINSGLQIWQSGASFGGAAGLRYTADMVINNSVGSTYSAAQIVPTVGQTDFDSGAPFYLNTSVTSVANANNFALITLPIESVRTLAGQTVTFSFYGQCTTGSRNIAIEVAQNFGSGGSPSAQVNTFAGQLTLTPTWSRQQVSVVVPSIAGKTLGSAVNDTLQVNIFMDAGSTFNSRTGSLGQQTANWNFFGFKLEVGQVATPYVLPQITSELNLCYRYYVQGLNGAVVAPIFWQGATTSAVQYNAAGNFPVPMRIVPIVTPSDTSIVGFAAGVSVAATTKGNVLVIKTANATNANSFFGCTYIADARL